MARRRGTVPEQRLDPHDLRAPEDRLTAEELDEAIRWVRMQRLGTIRALDQAEERRRRAKQELEEAEAARTEAMHRHHFIRDREYELLRELTRRTPEEESNA